MLSDSNTHIGLVAIQDVQRCTGEAEHDMCTRNISRLWSGASGCPHVSRQHIRAESKWPPAVLSIREVPVCIQFGST